MSSLKPFRYTYHGFDGKHRCQYCKVYKAHVTINDPDAFGIHYLDMCKTCLERMRITLKQVFKDYLADLATRKETVDK